jgi:D-arginine dehydrogenase
MEKADFLIIGGGIAGATAAAGLSALGQIILLEAEDAPGRHATGRSAAYFAPGYGNAPVRALTEASEAFFRAPPDGFSEVALLKPRPWVFLARGDQAEPLARMAGELGPALTRMDGPALEALVPILRPGLFTGGLFDDRGGDLDVDAYLQAALRAARGRGSRIESGARVTALARRDGLWQAETARGAFAGRVVVNAAGAWADELAALAGLAPVGLEPKRRTAILVPAPAGYESAGWPLAVDVEESFYFKPDAGALLISPADETPSAPCDAAPEELDVAIAVDRFETATTHAVRRVSHRWAGLRTFAPDRTPVVGEDQSAPGFFWLAGQGGYGVQTAPGMAAALMAAVEGRANLGLGEALARALSPNRFR